MPVLAAITYFSLIFKDDYLITPAVPLYLGQHSGTVDNRLADRDYIAVGNEQHLIQLNCATLGHFQTFYLDGLAFGYFILFATSFNNSVNFEPPKDTLYQFYS
ncbi:hypothetical protein ES703_113101 [subsurface metagenome]